MAQQFTLEERPSDSPYIQKVWRARSLHESIFTSVANSYWELVVSRIDGKTTLTLRGPETKATEMTCPANAEFVGIVFKPGVYMPYFPPHELYDLRDRELPSVTPATFRLNGELWHFPTFNNAESFVARLVREGLLVHDSVVENTLKGESLEGTQRTVQRHFLQTVGLPKRTLKRIEQAHYAANLLAKGMSIDTVAIEAGYADQSHLNRSLKHFLGLTPAQIQAKNSKQ
ncbi:MAG TPA: helix-turn-helix domain-containing protein [Candidatus Saccharimonadales bacterium]|nr:helix-turn-helix domain-containing protein [Candidatus Saccharimonadales bacterium]